MCCRTTRTKDKPVPPYNMPTNQAHACNDSKKAKERLTHIKQKSKYSRFPRNGWFALSKDFWMLPAPCWKGSMAAEASEDCAIDCF